jgi:hypothetical protein
MKQLGIRWAISVLLINLIFAGSLAAQRQWAPGAGPEAKKDAGPSNLSFTIAPSLGLQGGETRYPNSTYAWDTEANPGVAMEIGVRVYERPAGTNGLLALELPFCVTAHSNEIPPDVVYVHGLIIPTVRYDLKLSSYTISPGLGIGGGAVVQIGDKLMASDRVRPVFAYRVGISARLMPQLGISLNYLRADWKDESLSYWWGNAPAEVSTEVSMLYLGMVIYP